MHGALFRCHYIEHMVHLKHKRGPAHYSSMVRIDTLRMTHVLVNCIHNTLLLQSLMDKESFSFSNPTFGGFLLFLEMEKKLSSQSTRKKEHKKF